MVSLKWFGDKDVTYRKILDKGQRHTVVSHLTSSYVISFKAVTVIS